MSAFMAANCCAGIFAILLAAYACWKSSGWVGIASALTVGALVAVGMLLTMQGNEHGLLVWWLAFTAAGTTLAWLHHTRAS